MSVVCGKRMMLTTLLKSLHLLFPIQLSLEMTNTEIFAQMMNFVRFIFEDKSSYPRYDTR